MPRRLVPQHERRLCGVAPVETQKAVKQIFQAVGVTEKFLVSA